MKENIAKQMQEKVLKCIKEIKDELSCHTTLNWGHKYVLDTIIL